MTTHQHLFSELSAFYISMWSYLSSFFDDVRWLDPDPDGPSQADRFDEMTKRLRTLEQFHDSDYQEQVHYDFDAVEALLESAQQPAPEEKKPGQLLGLDISTGGPHEIQVRDVATGEVVTAQGVFYSIKPRTSLEASSLPSEAWLTRADQLRQYAQQLGLRYAQLASEKSITEQRI